MTMNALHAGIKANQFHGMSASGSGRTIPQCTSAQAVELTATRCGKFTISRACAFLFVALLPSKHHICSYVQRNVHV